MDLKYVHEFVVLSQILQFQEASEVLYMSQSSLSKHIKSMEQELGGELFIRSNRAVYLTEFGQTFLEYAEKLDEIEKEYTAALAEKKDQIQRISVGRVPYVTLYRFLKFFSGFVRENPGYQYNFRAGNELQLREWLAQGKVDLILTDDAPTEESGNHAVLYTEDTLCAVLPAERFSKGDYVPAQTLSKVPLIGYANCDSMYQHMEKQLGVSLNLTFRVETTQMMLELVRRGLGAAILPLQVARHYVTENESARACPIKPSAPIDIYMIYSSRKGHTPPIKAFEQYLLREKKTK